MPNMIDIYISFFRFYIRLISTLALMCHKFLPIYETQKFLLYQFNFFFFFRRTRKRFPKHFSWMNRRKLHCKNFASSNVQYMAASYRPISILPCNLQDSSFVSCMLHAKNFLSYNLHDRNFLLCNLQDSVLLSCHLQDSNLLSWYLQGCSYLLCNLQVGNFLYAIVDFTVFYRGIGKIAISPIVQFVR